MSDKLKHARVLVLGGHFYLIGDRPFLVQMKGIAAGVTFLRRSSAVGHEFAFQDKGGPAISAADRPHGVARRN